MSVQLTEVSRNFGNFIAVNKINIECKIGKITALMGENGAGKTTTLRLINGILKPTSGKISLFQLDSIQDRNKVKAITGILPESGGLYNRLTAKEYLYFIGSLYKLSNEAIQDHINQFFDLLRFKHDNTALEDLSRGMRQKVLFTASLINDPKVILLDEPTATFDPSISFRVKKLIKELAQTKIVLIASHNASLVEELADYVYIMNQGQIIAHGKPSELIKANKASDLEEGYLRIVEHFV
ncbi:MAG: ABC transporter ATP-binding protein [Candidatus Hodarchaeales archaeon]|jgi:ABC-2 type transport system ATP-binding protein